MIRLYQLYIALLISSCHPGLYASKTEFELARDAAGLNQTLSFRARTLSGGASKLREYAWDNHDGKYRLVSQYVNESEPSLSRTIVYTSTNRDTYLMGHVIRLKLNHPLKSLADYFTSSDLDSKYTIYTAFSTNVAGNSLVAFERTGSEQYQREVSKISNSYSNVSSILPKLFAFPAREIVIYGTNGMLQQVTKYTQSNTIVSSTIFDRFEYKTSPLHAFSESNKTIINVRSESENSDVSARLVLSSIPGINTGKWITISATVFVLVVAAKWISAATRSRKHKTN